MADAKQMRIAAPQGVWPQATTAGASNHSLDASNDGVAFVFMAADTNAITHLGFRYGSRTGTPPTYRISLQSPDASAGSPDGTVLGGGSPASATFAPPADATWDGTWQWVALSNSYTPTRGQYLCSVIEYSSGTVDGSNNSSITRNLGNLAANTQHAMPTSWTLTAGSWSKQTGYPPFGVRTASTRYGQIATGSYTTRSASTVGIRHALKFNVPATWWSTYTIRGFRCAATLAGATGKNPIAGLWSASSALQTVTLDSDIDRDGTNHQWTHEILFDESSLSSLAAGTDYYIGLEVADGTNGGLALNGLTVSEADNLLAYPGGTAFHFATYNGSAWSDDQTIRPFVELILDDITAPSSGSGGLIIGPSGLIY